MLALSHAARHPDHAISAAASAAVRPVLLAFPRFPADDAVHLAGLACLRAVADLAEYSEAAWAAIDDLSDALVEDVAELVSPDAAAARGASDAVKARSLTSGRRRGKKKAFPCLFFSLSCLPSTLLTRCGDGPCTCCCPRARRRQRWACS